MLLSMVSHMYVPGFSKAILILLSPRLQRSPVKEGIVQPTLSKCTSTYWAAASIDSSVISLLFVLSSVFYSGSTVSNNNIGLRHES